MSEPKEQPVRVTNLELQKRVEDMEKFVKRGMFLEYTNYTRNIPSVRKALFVGMDPDDSAKVVIWVGGGVQSVDREKVKVVD